MTEKWTIGLPGAFGTHNVNTIHDENGNPICQIYKLPLHTTLEEAKELKQCREGLKLAERIRNLPEIEETNKRLQKALNDIIAIENKTYGSDHDEIEEARAIAKEALDNIPENELKEEEPPHQCPDCKKYTNDKCEECGLTYGRRGWRQIGVYDG